MKKGHLFVISAPSGTGKSTVISSVKERLADFEFSVSYTTRKIRSDERRGKDYHFVGREEFMKLVGKGIFVEWAEVHGNLYGTPRAPIEKAIAAGRNMIFNIDVQGGMAIKRVFPDAITIFLLPPSLKELSARLAGRGTESPAQIRLRLENAQNEMKFRDKYDHCIVNDDIERASSELAKLIEQIVQAY
jgi:guanylate kinase